MSRTGRFDVVKSLRGLFTEHRERLAGVDNAQTFHEQLIFCSAGIFCYSRNIYENLKPDCKYLKLSLTVDEICFLHQPLKIRPSNKLLFPANSIGYYSESVEHKDVVFQRVLVVNIKNSMFSHI